MSPHAYTEDHLVEQPAIGLFVTLLYSIHQQIQYLHCFCDLLLPRLLTGQIEVEAV